MYHVAFENTYFNSLQMTMLILDVPILIAFHDIDSPSDSSRVRKWLTVKHAIVPVEHPSLKWIAFKKIYKILLQGVIY